ncbi:MaoC family dehydratase [Microbaculum marinisediminis]|uniref:MaoC family dehydratase n=1 Tax=Microbaculum marinisediminis TaxID=2931392 RepID=A0AAW5R2I0_9HYPH|nr:MaoC family dehydratase [Microbaculum sp. A6E488]MCT8973570.1 MaoC family dehydratase [Microbaculum sp. A6E488]
MPNSPDLYLEDIRPGLRFDTRSETITEADIIDFAERFDPQYFHVDPEAAKGSAFGGLVASGLHTLSVTMRLFFDLKLWPNGIIGSPGMNEVRWTRPVKPGDTLTSSLEVVAVKPSRSKPDRGVVTTSHETVNQNGETVFTALCLHMVRRRSPA